MSMRAIVVHPGPAWSTADVYRGWVGGLRACDVDVRTFNLDARYNVYSSAHRQVGGDFEPIWPDLQAVAQLVGHDLHSACFQFRPDVVVVISARILHPFFLAKIREHGVKVVIVHTESPYEDVEQLQMAQFADVNLVNDPTNLADFEALGPAAYVPHAYDPHIHHPGPSQWDLDFAWVGTAGNTFPSRTRFFEQVDFGDARVLLAGLWDGVDETSPIHRHLIRDGVKAMIDNTTTADLYRGTRISANLYRTAGDNTDSSFIGGWAMGPREVELAATGCFFARHSPPDHGGEGDQVLSMLPTFTEPAELTDIIRHYLAHPHKREQLADQARAAVADRTFAAHAARLLEQL